MAFQVLPNIVAQPKPIVRWQYAAATVLFGLTLLSATQLGLLANVSKLPKVEVDTDSCICMFTCIIRLDVMLRVTQPALAVAVLVAATSFVASLMHQSSLHTNYTICLTGAGNMLDMASSCDCFLHLDVL